MLIFDEKSYALKLISDGFACFMSIRDLSILAKYYRTQGMSFKQIEHELTEFCKKYNPQFNEVRNGYVIKKAVGTAKKYKMREINEVIVTKSELSKIRTVQNYKYEKVLFAMLVIAKFFKHGVRIKPSDHPKPWSYYVNAKLSEVMKLAGVRANKTQRNQILFELTQLGFIEATYTGGLKICYADDCSEPAVVVDQFEDIGKYYPPYCMDCGKVISAKAKRCNDCVNKMNKQNDREYARKRYREKKNNKI